MSNLNLQRSPTASSETFGKHSLATQITSAIFILSLSGTGASAQRLNYEELAKNESTSGINVIKFKPKATKLHTQTNIPVQTSPESMIEGFQRNYSLKISQLSEILNVSRPTIYNWKKGTDELHEENMSRISKLSLLLSVIPEQYKPFTGKFYKRKLTDGRSLRSVLIDESSSTAQILELLSLLEPSMDDSLARNRTSIMSNESFNSASAKDAIEGRGYAGA